MQFITGLIAFAQQSAFSWFLLVQAAAAKWKMQIFQLEARGSLWKRERKGNNRKSLRVPILNTNWIKPPMKLDIYLVTSVTSRTIFHGVWVCFFLNLYFCFVLHIGIDSVFILSEYKCSNRSQVRPCERTILTTSARTAVI